MGYQVTIEYGDDLLFNLGMSRSEFDGEARFLLAAKLFELGKLTSGQAAKLCGKERVDFLLGLARVGVAMVNLDAEELEHDLRFGRGA